MRPFISSLKSGSFTLMSGWELRSIATEQVQSVDADGVVLDDAFVEAVRSPGFGEEADRNRLAESVELQTTASTSIHNGSIVNHLNWNVLLLRTNPEVRVRGGTKFEKERKLQPKYIADDEERHVRCTGVFQNHFIIRLNEITISNDYFTSKQLFLRIISLTQWLPIFLCPHTAQKCNSLEKSYRRTSLPPVLEE